ncbi:Glutathione S-transferase domain protein [Streptomyces venezuelae]|uniref:glutathione S-transferase C-terminal domain-containing protein n=1 Tax=Streptomyces gardneri TaxID=66892 RepID=UPI0006BD5F65|nr:glutathione S-transferase C-terminal domain-containing protein [Streptomyces gardneri]ALO06532.1 Glutathione S-transferase domain protein [Streptomyces venezuelae]QPK43958.1 glutathione S-transferase C-terminal domain-containing protein [Streptomyces gardneri]WRK35224.1 glutathione S-transferase C-terminal domain-containing protein [Streptomyces venezuelae]CUM43193.1 Glutathione S-transferase domain protein [Streptomyces venezuelae]
MSVVPSSLLPASAVPAFRGRIGRDVRSGHYAVPHRYRLHLAPAGPGCLSIALTHGLLGLDDTLPMIVLPGTPDTPDGGYTTLRPLYEASAHLYAGPSAAPVLSDGWTGRIVSTHVPDVLRDLALRFRGDGPDLLPEEHRGEIEAITDLCERSINRAAQRAGELGLDGDAAHHDPLGVLFAALGSLERRLTGSPYVLGDRPTAADVQVWVTLVQLDTVHRWHLDAAAMDRVAGHPALWAYAQRLAARPEFARHLDIDAVLRRHSAHCRGHEAAGAGIRIVDWSGTSD